MALAIFLYGHTLNAPWYLDDTINILEPLYIRNFGNALHTIFWPRGPAIFSFAINYQMGGFSLPIFHATNIAIHAIASGLTYLIAKRVFPANRLLALLVAAIFLAHPLQTQAITYIVQRMTSLAALFGFLSLYLYIRAREALNQGRAYHDWRHLLWLVGALGSGAIAVHTKQNMATLPLALMLFDTFFLQQPDGRKWQTWQRIGYAAPFFLAPAAEALSQLYAPMSAGVSLATISFVQEKVEPMNYLVTELSVIWLYLKLLFVPHPQLLDYAYPVSKELITAKSVLAFTGLSALSTAAFLSRHRFPHLAFGLFWLLIGLLIESSLIPLDPVFEHRLYLPMFGFAVALVGTGRLLLAEKQLLAAGLCCLLIFSGLTWRRNALWNDSLALLSDNLRHISPDDNFLLSLTTSMLQRKRYDDTINLLKDRVEEGSREPGIYVNAAIAHRMKQSDADVIRIVTRAAGAGIRNQDLDLEIARAYRRSGDPSNAFQAYRNALNSNAPRRGSDPARNREYITAELANFLVESGRNAEGESLLRAALAGRPHSVRLRYELANLLAKRGEADEAQKLLRAVVSAAPGDKLAWYAFALQSRKINDTAAFNEAHDKLMQLDPEMAANLRTEGSPHP